MNNPFQIFNSPIFGQVRAAFLVGKPYFVAKDVCRALALGNVSRACSRLDKADLAYCFIPVHVISSNTEAQRKMLCVNESGLYSLVLNSRKPDAQEFKHWVTSEVLPAIRENGSYSLFNDDDIPFNKKFSIHARNAEARDFKAFKQAQRDNPPAQVETVAEQPLIETVAELPDFERAQFLAQFVPLLPQDDALPLVKEIVKLTLGRNIF